MISRKYWFTRKKYGWGWGMPCAWQGWLVYAVAFGLLLAGPFLFSPFREPIAFQLYTWAVVLVLVLICWMKGAPPGWRWGSRTAAEAIFGPVRFRSAGQSMDALPYVGVGQYR